jgi:esterase
MKLYFRTLGSGQPIVIMHGVFGTCDNWITVSKELAKTNTIYLLDLRNHGQSPHSDTFNYEAMASDLDEFLTEHQLQKPIIIGHSMGGKVAMRYAKDFTNIGKLIVVDISPRYYLPHHQTILKGLNAMPLGDLQSRNQADEFLQAYIPELGVRQFLLKNLYRNEEGKFGWRLNLPIITEKIHIVGEALGDDTRIDVPTLFIKGGKSDYILADDEVLIKKIFSNATVTTIENAGH